MFKNKRPREEEGSASSESDKKAKKEQEEAINASEVEEGDEESSEEESEVPKLPSLEHRMRRALETGSLDISLTRMTVGTFKEEVISFLDKNPKITSLDASCEPKIADELCQYLSTNETLKHVEMRHCSLSTDGAKLLATNKKIGYLAIGNNSIGDEGAIALAGNQVLKGLMVDANEISEIGAKALSSNKTLIFLDLKENKMGDEGIKALIKNNTLKGLSLCSSDVSDMALRMFALNDSISQLRMLGYDKERPALDKITNEISEKRIGRHKEQLHTFLMGTHPRVGAGSPILHSFRRNQFYEPKVIKQISDFLKPIPCELRLVF